MKRPLPKYQVFVSSTYQDLRKERQAVIWTILKQFQIPSGMEAFPATDDRGWKTIQAVIDDSDYYVVLLAGKYGSIDEKTGLSWTHTEYRYALEREVPVFAFIRKEEGITANLLDTDPATKAKLDAFKEELRAKHQVKEWTTTSDLCELVGQALANQIRDDEHGESPRPGWIRGNLVPRIALEELARLSAESAHLRAEVERLQHASKSVLSVVLPDGRPLAGKVFDQDFSPLTLADEQSPSSNGLILPAEPWTIRRNRIEQWLDRRNRTIWVNFAVTNTGTETARDVVIEVEFLRTVEVLFDEEAPPKHEIVSRLVPPTPQTWDDGISRFGTDTICLTKTIGFLHPGQILQLPTLGAIGQKFIDRVVEIQVAFRVHSESGVQNEAQVLFRKTALTERMVTRDELTRLPP